MIKFDVSYNLQKNKRTYTLSIDDANIIECRLSKFDRLLIEKCEESMFVADKLLGLETIIRRIEEENK